MGVMFLVGLIIILFVMLRRAREMAVHMAATGDVFGAE